MTRWRSMSQVQDLVSLSLLVSASSLPQMVGTTLPTSKSPWQMGTPCNWIVQSSQILNPEKGFIHISFILYVFISSYLRISPNSWIFYNFLSPSKQSNPTPTFPGVYSVPRFQRPRPMELRTGRRGSRSSRSFQRSTFQRPLLHLENSHSIPCVPFPKKKVGWKMCLEFVSFCVCVCVSEEGCVWCMRLGMFWHVQKYCIWKRCWSWRG